MRVVPPGMTVQAAKAGADRLVIAVTWEAVTVDREQVKVPHGFFSLLPRQFVSLIPLRTHDANRTK